MPNEANSRGGEVCIELPDSRGYSDAEIHEQILNGVDTSEFEMTTRAKLLAQGVPISVLDRVLPDKART